MRAQPPSPKGTARKGIRLDDLVSLKVLPLALLGGLFSFKLNLLSSFFGRSSCYTPAPAPSPCQPAPTTCQPAPKPCGC